MDYQFLHIALQVTAASTFAYVYIILMRFKSPQIFFALFIALNALALYFKYTSYFLYATGFFGLAALLVLPVALSIGKLSHLIALSSAVFAFYALIDPLLSGVYFVLSEETTIPLTMAESDLGPFLATYAVSILLPLIAASLLDWFLRCKSTLLRSKNTLTTILIISLHLSLFVGLAVLARSVELPMVFAPLFVVALIIFVVFDFVLIAVRKKHDEAHEKLLRAELVEKELSAIESVSPVFSAQLEMLHRLRHDMTNHMLTIEALASEGKPAEAKAILGNLRNALNSWDVHNAS